MLPETQGIGCAVYERGASIGWVTGLITSLVVPQQFSFKHLLCLNSLRATHQSSWLASLA